MKMIKPIDPDKPMVALTFDDGPSPKYTERILDALKEYNASATFFVLGSNAENAPKLLQRMVLEGNEIGNHTYSHKQLTTLSKPVLKKKSKKQRSVFIPLRIFILMYYDLLMAVKMIQL